MTATHAGIAIGALVAVCCASTDNTNHLAGSAVHLRGGSCLFFSRPLKTNEDSKQDMDTSKIETKTNHQDTMENTKSKDEMN